jgi:enolase
MERCLIEGVECRKIIDSRGVTSIEVDVKVVGGMGRASAPLGAPGSRGLFEPPAYPEGGVDEAIQILNSRIAPKLKGMDGSDQRSVDSMLRELDGTPNFAEIGGNTATVVSIAVAKAAACALGLPLYRYLGGPFASELSNLIGNTIGGGPHARIGKAPDMQEHQVIPVGAKTMADAVFACVKAHRKANELLVKKFPDFTGGADDESAWAPNATDREALEILALVCEDIEDETGIEMRLGIDVASANMWDSEKKVYVYQREGVERDTGEQLDFISDLIETFPLYYVEDMFHDDDFESFAELNKKYGKKCLICGDDLLSSNLERLRKGIEMNAVNSLIIKVNQVGTLSDAYETVRLAKENQVMPIKSCRSGETEDTAIAHLAVAWGCPLNKFAITGKGPAKLNELMRIEAELGGNARMPKLPFI